MSPPELESRSDELGVDARANDRVGAPAGQRSSSKPGQTDDASAGGDESSRSGVPVWLFVLLLVAFIGVTGWQYNVTSDLETEIVGLEGELSDTRALLGAHQSRLSEIRGGVRDLSAQIEGLRALVDSEVESTGNAPKGREGRVQRSSGNTSDNTSGNTSDREIPARLTRLRQPPSLDAQATGSVGKFP